MFKFNSISGAQQPDHAQNSSAHPTISQYIIFYIKTRLLIARRLFVDVFVLKPQKFVPFSDNKNSHQVVISESITPLWTEETLAERQLQLGKVQNLRIAIRSIDGITVSANKIFSFWKQVGQPRRWRGYVVGRELRQGCLIPSVGGGLCQLSNALYDAALKADFKIFERHAHTQSIPGSAVEEGKDATVFWNYVDLRFSHKTDYKISAELTHDELVLRFCSVANP